MPPLYLLHALDTRQFFFSLKSGALQLQILHAQFSPAICRQHIKWRVERYTSIHRITYVALLARRIGDGIGNYSLSQSNFHRRRRRQRVTAWRRRRTVTSSTLNGTAFDAGAARLASASKGDAFAARDVFVRRRRHHSTRGGTSRRQLTALQNVVFTAAETGSSTSVPRVVAN